MAEEGGFDIRDISRPPNRGNGGGGAAGGGALADMQNRMRQLGTGCGGGSSPMVLGIGCGGAVLLLIVGIFMSLGSLGPTEYGIVYSKFTKQVQSGTVYRGGRHLIGPLSALVSFPATAQTIEFSSRKGATAPTLSTRTAEGLALELDLSFQYMVVKDELAELYKLANVNFEALYVKLARDVLLKAAARFTAPQYWQERMKIGEVFTELISTALDGSHVHVYAVQLLVIQLPSQYEDSIVTTQVQKQGVSTKENQQLAAVIRAKILAMVADYQKTITVTLNAANAGATVATKNAEAEASRRMIDAESIALKMVAKSIPKLSPSAQVEYQLNFAYQTINNASFLFGVKNAVTVLGAAPAGGMGSAADKYQQASVCPAGGRC